MSKKILITGITGKLGSRISEHFRMNGYEVSGISIDEPDTFLDISDWGEVKKRIIEYRPEIVIHTAAIVNPDHCETDRDRAYNVNVRGTMNLAEACKLTGSFMINISSDFIFDGKRGPYGENDAPNPANYYGVTKLEAEEKLKEILPLNHSTVRTCVLYDWNNQTQPNFAMWLVKQLKEQKKVIIVNDQFANPTYIPDLVEAIYFIGEHKINQTINVCGKDWIDRYSFALKISEYFNLDNSLIKSSNSLFFKQIASRPLRAGLKTEKAERLGIIIKGVDSGLERMVKNAKR